MLPDLLLLLAGLALLFAGGEGLVRGAVALAHRLGLSPLVIGLVIVGFGTSMPELLVSVDAALVGSPDIAIGNVVGSNISNTLLIIGISGLIFPIAAPFIGLKRDLTVMIASSILMVLIGLHGEIGRPIGALMFAALAAYLAYVYVTDRRAVSANGDAEPATGVWPAWKTAGFLVAGLGMLFFGADLLVSTATRMARDLDISEAVIGLTIVAIGTSLPELATAVIAAFRRHSEVAIGNVVGSNIFNLLGILGVTAIITPLDIAGQIARFDIPVMLAVAVLMAAVIAVKSEIARPIAAGFTALYVLYLYMLF